MSKLIEVNSSLDGVIVGETAISLVDGEAGRLLYRGRDIATLTSQPCLRIAGLLVWGRFLSTDEQAALDEFFAHQAVLQKADLALLQGLPAGLHPMRVLLSCIPALQVEPPPSLNGLPAPPDLLTGLSICAKLPGLLASWHCLQQGLPLPCQAQGLNPLESFLLQFHNRAASDLAINTLNAVQVLQMEHGFNASTFAARVCGSTRAPIAAVLATAIATLYGPLHGGADQAALEMALELGKPERATSYVREKLASGEKIMGMGHREYRVLDPRAAILKPMAEALCEQAGQSQVVATLSAIEKACQAHFAARGREIHANVEFYKGGVFHALGFPAEYFTALFAMARCFGYMAHWLEFQHNARLIRPKARYTGPVRGRQ